MKTLDINMLRPVPKNVGAGFALCYYGQVPIEVKELMIEKGFSVLESAGYTNFTPAPEVDFYALFEPVEKIAFMDGFSPNLNKKLHVGHFSNFVIAKAFQKLGVVNTTVSLLGDTLDGEVKKEEALADFKALCNEFDYTVDEIFYASQMKYSGSLLVDGEGEYAGTKIVDVEGEKIVVVKSDGSTSYFYQDMAFAETLGSQGGKTLYLTGYEQNNHFSTLNKIYPHTQHIGLGLVKVQPGKMSGVVKQMKMSSRSGNVIFLQDLLQDFVDEFKGDKKLAYNVFAGFILKNKPQTDKKFTLDSIHQHENSPGLYLSYTLARLKSAGIEVSVKEKFDSQELAYSFLKSQHLLNPQVLFNSMCDLAKHINSLYATHRIQSNEENKKMFTRLGSDLALGMDKLGMYLVDAV